MSKKVLSRILSCLLIMALLLAFVSDSAFDRQVFATGTKPDWVTQDQYDDLICYSYKDRDFYFADSYFAQPGSIYNPHLATVSMYSADRSGDFGGIPDNATDEKIEEWCKEQPSSLRAFWNTIGFTDFDCNNDYVSRSSFSTIGVGVASKKIEVNGESYTVLSVCPRSGSYFREWGNNVWLGDGSASDYMHEGWYDAANKLIAYLKQYVKEHKVTGNVKLWMMGFSRGGATTNIAAGLLDNMIDHGETVFEGDVKITLDDIYAYTFEAPQGANIYSKTVKPPKDPLYSNIWNIINPLDLVPKVAMSEYGFTRFGTDKYITTQFYDPGNYEKNRYTFKKLYEDIGCDYSDYDAEDFDMYGMDIGYVVKILNALTTIQIPNDLEFISRDRTKENYDANIAVMLLLEEATENIGDRSDYCRTLQRPLSDLLVIFSDDQGALVEENKEKAISDLIRVVVLIASATVAVGNIASPFEVISALNIVSDNRVLADIDRCIFPLLEVVGSTYWDRPNELISVGMYAGKILKNHNTDVTLTHVMCQDSYYIDRHNSKCREAGDPETSYVTIVPFRDNADYGRMSFDCFNDIGLRVKGDLVVDVEGFLCGKSVVNKCDPGYAVGYYSYVIDEAIELFFPVDTPVNISMKDYSKKFRHTVTYNAYYQHFTLTDSNEVKRPLGSLSERCWFNSDRYFRDVVASS